MLVVCVKKFFQKKAYIGGPNRTFTSKIPSFSFKQTTSKTQKRQQKVYNEFNYIYMSLKVDGFGFFF